MRHLDAARFSKDEIVNIILRAHRGGEPLSLALAMVVRCSAPLGYLDLSRSDNVVHVVARQELGRLRRLANAFRVDEKSVAYAVALCTFIGGSTRDEIDNLLTREADINPTLASPHIKAIVEILETHIDVDEYGNIGAIKPDMVGEAFIIAAFDYCFFSLDEQAKIVERLFEYAPESVFFILHRMAEDFGLVTTHRVHIWLQRIEVVVNERKAKSLSNRAMSLNEADRMSRNVRIKVPFGANIEIDVVRSGA